MAPLPLTSVSLSLSGSSGASRKPRPPRPSRSQGEYLLWDLEVGPWSGCWNEGHIGVFPGGSWWEVLRSAGPQVLPERQASCQAGDTVRR